MRLNPRNKVVLARRLEGIRVAAIPEKEKNSHGIPTAEIFLDHLFEIAAASEKPAMKVRSVDGAGHLPRDDVFTGGEKFVSPGFVTGEFIKIDTAGIVVLVQIQGEGEATSFEEGGPGPNERTLQIFERAVQVDAAMVTPGVLDESVGVEAGENHDGPCSQNSRITLRPVQ